MVLAMNQTRSHFLPIDKDNEHKSTAVVLFHKTYNCYCGLKRPVKHNLKITVFGGFVFGGIISYSLNEATICSLHHNVHKIKSMTL